MSFYPSIIGHARGIGGATPGVRAAQLLRTMVPSAALCIAILSLTLPPANAQSNISAREAWYGIYEREEGVGPVIPPKSNTDRIPGRQGTNFGFSYVLSGGTSQDATVKQVVRFPNGTVYSQARTAPVGEPDLLGYRFLHAPEDNRFGEWSLEVWEGDRKLLERRFTVYQP